MSDESRTLRGWRELKGMSRGDLAEAAGYPEEHIERWEEVGWDWEPHTLLGDVHGQEVLQAVVKALEIDGAIKGVHRPDGPSLGHWVVDPARLPPEVRDHLAENAEGYGVWASLESEWGPYLKPLDKLEHEDLRLGVSAATAPPDRGGGTAS